MPKPADARTNNRQMVKYCRHISPNLLENAKRGAGKLQLYMLQGKNLYFASTTCVTPAITRLYSKNYCCSWPPLGLQHNSYERKTGLPETHDRSGCRHTWRARLLELQWSMASSMFLTRMTGMTGPNGSSHAMRMSCNKHRSHSR